MSGGSFNYLYSLDAAEAPTVMGDLQDMAKALTGVGAHGAASETEAVIAYIEHSQRQIGVRIESLRDVWHAMEWWRSGDSGALTFYAAMEKYNAR